MKLTKQVPSRTVTLTALWVRRNWMKMNDQYREIRSKARSKMDKCHWCKHCIENGEMFALACFEKVGNKVLCDPCAAKLERSSEDEPTQETD